jgi:hypothetical protein
LFQPGQVFEGRDPRPEESDMRLEPPRLAGIFAVTVSTAERTLFKEEQPLRDDGQGGSAYAGRKRRTLRAAALRRNRLLSARTKHLETLVPRPQLHLIRFHGVLAPNARLRPDIIPNVPVNVNTPSADHAEAPPAAAPARLSWARLLKRVFDLEARAGVDATLRDAAHKGNRWSRAW